MAKKDFTTNLLGTNRAKKLDILVAGAAPEAEAPVVPPPTAKSPQLDKAPAAKASEPEPIVTAPESAPAPKAKVPEAPKKRGRKKMDIEKDSFFYTVDKAFLFEVKAAAFWDRRDISEFITLALRHYMDKELGEGEMRRAVREYKKRLEE